MKGATRRQKNILWATCLAAKVELGIIVMVLSDMDSTGFDSGRDAV